MARSPAERVVERSMVDGAGVGRPLSDRARQRMRSVESYLRGEALPRYVQRAREIERAVRDHEQRLAELHAELRASHAEDRDAFAAAWTEVAHAQDFAEVNELVRQHNEWYPVERDLPMDPRTGDYVQVSGRSYRRQPLDAAWVLARFPPR